MRQGSRFTFTRSWITCFAFSWTLLPTKLLMLAIQKLHKMFQQKSGSDLLEPLSAWQSSTPF